mmetsp:Transcript_24217/g.61223  ORF Transcript_24217/g.61223 Transcript_24217/m.61223 type:complete len:97 (-) Transcript_24217:191-481(-)
MFDIDFSISLQSVRSENSSIYTLLEVLALTSASQNGGSTPGQFRLDVEFSSYLKSQVSKERFTHTISASKTAPSPPCLCWPSCIAANQLCLTLVSL